MSKIRLKLLLGHFRILEMILIFIILSSKSWAQTDSLYSIPKWAMNGFIRVPKVNPLISPIPNSRFWDPLQNKEIEWESSDTFNPGAAVYRNHIIVLYRAEDNSGTGIGFKTSRLGYAISPDGIHFHRKNGPVLFPGLDPQKKYDFPGGCEDPRIACSTEGIYYVFYTSWNREIPRLSLATSTDLIHWHKKGPIFAQAYHGKFLNIPSKSASILTKIIGGKQLIYRFKGHYWMYWGEEHVYMAKSKDLIHWTPLLNPDSSLFFTMSPRKGFFDSELTECGPPALWTPKGILLFYNGKNKSGIDGDSRFNPTAYCAGQALFDPNNPEKYLSRLDFPFLIPKEPFEKSGQYPGGTVFMEGMAYFKKKWYLYYGCADSRVGVACMDPLHSKKSNLIPIPHKF